MSIRYKINVMMIYF